MNKRKEQWKDNERCLFDQGYPGSRSRNHEISSLETDEPSSHFVGRGRNSQRGGGRNRHRRKSGQAQRGFFQRNNRGNTDGRIDGTNKIQSDDQDIRSEENKDRPWENRLSQPGKRRGTYSRSRTSCYKREGNQRRGRGPNSGGTFCFERFSGDMPASSSETSDYSGSENELEFEGSTYRYQVSGKGRNRNQMRGRVARNSRSCYSDRISEYWSGVSEYDDSDSNDETEFNGPIVCPEENEVFSYFIKKIRGPSSLTKIAKSNLFPKEFDISGWFRSHQSRFILFEKKGKVHFILPFFKEATFCFSYNGLNKKNHCGKSDCPHAHVCKDFIGRSCKKGNKCHFSHNFLDGSNSHLIYKLGLNMFSNDEIRLIYSQRFPHVCSKHISDHLCSRPVCAYLHICCDFLLGNCELETTCPWGHSLFTDQNQNVLKAYNLTHWKEQLIKKITFTPCSFIIKSENRTGKDTSSISSMESMLGEAKGYENEHDREEHSRNSLSEEQKRKSRCRSKSRANTYECNRSSTPYSRQMHEQDTWNLGKVNKTRRSKSRDDTELHKRSSTPYWEERKTRCRSKSIGATDRDKKYINLHGEQKTKYGYRSKLRDASKNCKISTTSDLVLEMDSAESTPICDSFIVGMCKTAGCSYHHIDSIRLPYIWQIRMNDKWVTLDNTQMSGVERDYCSKKISSQIMVFYGGNNYTATVTFPKSDMKTAVVAVKGQVPKTVSIRRFSTASYAEGTNITGGASFRTQWRWFYLDDFKTWCSFEPELLQFTLEQKYTSKCQDIYLFSREKFSYQIDFKDMKQTNIDTGKKRELLRCPLFVSEDDVKFKHYPAMISIPTGATTPFPSSWVPWDLAHKFELVKLQQDSAEFKQVECSFFTTLLRNQFLINDICRVQNMDLWAAYCGQKNCMKGNLERSGQTKEVDERSLFHGTDTLDIVKGICTNCFDFRVCGKNGTVYGKGAYFARDASYSHNYTKCSVVKNERYMFLAKVLVGEYTVGSSSYTRPPNKPGGTGHLLFDSCVDSMNNPSIFVVFDLKQCYPAYLICYTKVEKVSQHQYALSASNLQGTYSSSNVNSSPAPVKRISSIKKNSSSLNDQTSLQKSFSSSSLSIQSSSSTSTLLIQKSQTATGVPSSVTTSHRANVQRSPSYSVKSTSSNSNVSLTPSHSVTSGPSSQTGNHQASLPSISLPSSPSVQLTNLAPSENFHRPHLVTSSSTSSHSNSHTAAYGVFGDVQSAQKSFSSSSLSIQSSSSASTLLFQKSQTATGVPSSVTTSHEANLQKSPSYSVKSTSSNSNVSLTPSHSVTSGPSSQTGNHQASLPSISLSSSPSVQLTNLAPPENFHRPYLVTSSSTSSHSNSHTAAYGVSGGVHSSQLPFHRSFDDHSQLSQDKGLQRKMSDCCIL